MIQNSACAETMHWLEPRDVKLTILAIGIIWLMLTIKSQPIFQRPAHRHTRTGSFEWVNTFCVTLPRSTAFMPLRP